MHSPKAETVNGIKDRLNKLFFRLSLGEIECIALCLDTDDKILISDDDDAKRFAKTYGIDGKGTIYILLKSYKVGLLSKRECIETFESIVGKGFWISADVVSLFYKILEKNV